MTSKPELPLDFLNGCIAELDETKQRYSDIDVPGLSLSEVSMTIGNKQTGTSTIYTYDEMIAMRDRITGLGEHLEHSNE